MSRVAVCIASYNSATFLSELLESLKDQTFKDFEVHIVYDGSEDDTPAVIEKYRDYLSIIVPKYETVARCGLNKNKVVASALSHHADYIQMIDADDKVLPRFLEAGLEGIANVNWVVCWGRLFHGRTGYIHSEIPTLGDLMNNNNKIHSWGMFERKIFEKHNFAENLRSGVDWEHWIRVIGYGYVGKIVKEELYLKRWHEKSVTLTVRKTHEELRNEVLVTSFRKIINETTSSNNQ